MDTTKEKILKLAKNPTGVSAHQIITTLNKNASGIFRHLKKLAEQGKLRKIGKPPKVLYYNSDSMNNNANDSATDWARSQSTPAAPIDALAPTRDVFQTRQEKLLTTLKNLLPENILYLLVSAAGEIGNNSFDHNLGNWRDVMGVLFIVDTANRTIILADRGQGVFATIKRVRPQTTDDRDALRAAFTEPISGRAPEQRGNGLKFVKKVMEENDLTLEFYSGRGMVKITNGKFAVENSDINIPGSLAIIKF